MCASEGRTTAAEEVDHIIPLHKGGADTDDNLQCLCRAHHHRKTVLERGDTYRGGCDANGVPRDAGHHWRG